MNDIKVKDVMTHLVVTVRPQDSIQEAARRLLDNRISGAPVVERGRLVGVFSEADLVAAYTPPARTGTPFVAVDPIMFLLRGTVPREAGHTTVADIMTRDVVSVSPDASLWEAASLIDRHGIRRLPVVDPDGYVVGVLARADLVRAMARSDEDLAPVVRKAIEVLGEENFTSLGVEASGGAVTISGTADRRTTHDLAIRIASRVPGVLEVMDELDWQWDDRNLKLARNPRDPREVRREPWVVGPFVREGT
jgi:Predicted transcriptional regulator, contains C-terminal CBS domains